ncbi:MULTISPECIES: hypothetical protein [Thermomonosporaceae]|nr:MULTISPECIES: hypothetical protein [Thermomonosporaceae]MDL4772942.1 hypothetical protein [Actinomadura xylanilytica]
MAIRRGALLRLVVLRASVEGCGADEEYLAAWEQAWRRIRFGDERG